MNFIRVTLLLICCAFLTGCGENPLTFPVETITTTRNTEEETEKMDTCNTDDETDEVVEFFDNYADLLDFLGLDFTGMEITSMEVTNKQYVDDFGSYFNPCVVFFLNGSRDSFYADEIHVFEEFYDTELESRLSSLLLYFKKWRIKINDVQAFGVSMKDYEVYEGDGEWSGEVFEQHWYLLDNSDDTYKGNIYLRAYIPFAVEIDVEKIISSQGE